ncbi:hypothetical protein GUJ93_ZPchr0012g20220 [Zizania palustris]|uniref:Uncharacterized protein n=1 Tax=Zizania palustris TaxID=103762 RepID=A0A8J5WU79_ZIZPA|nr:hypothetical protein GUJ93_ZPchr0012g20220 [Zizania palustris]
MVLCGASCGARRLCLERALRNVMGNRANRRERPWRWRVLHGRAVPVLQRTTPGERNLLQQKNIFGLLPLRFAESRRAEKRTIAGEEFLVEDEN